MSDRRLGDVVRERRRHLGMTQEQLAEAAGTSSATIKKLEQGVRDQLRPATARALETALRWEAGSVERIAEGGAPVEYVESRPLVVEAVVRPEYSALLVMVEGTDEETQREALRAAMLAAARVIDERGRRE